MARAINLIVIHCSDSPNGRTLFTGSAGDDGFVTPVQEIDRWHRERGFTRLADCRKRQNPLRTSIGYHFVIYTRGAVATGRHIDEAGAHARGYNENSLGICLIGCDQFTRAQWDSLRDLLCGLAKQMTSEAGRTDYRWRNPSPLETMEIFHKAGIRVVGHRDLNPAKTCPNFSIAEWFNAGMQPPAGQIYPDPVDGDKA